MGCDLVYSNRELVQLRAGKVGVCRIWYVPSNKEDPKKPICIRRAVGPNMWSSSYIFPAKASEDLAGNEYYWIEGSDVRYVFIDSIKDAWFFSNRVDFECAIAHYKRHGPAQHLRGTTHFSDMKFSAKLNLIASRYARVLSNKLFEPEAPEPDSSQMVAPGDDQIRDILDFEFNKPKPRKKIENPYGLDFEAIAREALGEDQKT